MIDDIIDQIKDSENTAKGIITSSKKEAAEIIERAYQQANQIIKDGEQEIKDLLDDAAKRAKKNVEKEIKKLSLENDSVLEKSKKDFLDREENTISKIIKRVID